MLVNAIYAKDATDETARAVEALSGENSFNDRREENQESYSSYWVFRVAAYGFLTIIALITIFHIMNSISMSVSAGMKQYGAMRAVGMSMKQMMKMIAAEAVTYVLCGMAVGFAGGLFIHRLIITKLLITHFGGTWKIPMEPIEEVLLFVVLSCIVAVRVPMKRLRSMAITEIINEL